jgi:DNA-binding PadR family transcriptional regulator
MNAVKTVPDLPATAWAVLGLLSFGRELTGYDLKKWADASLRFFYGSPAFSQIYGELERLRRIGYVTSRGVARHEPRKKRLYAITPEGREALTAWVDHAPVEPPVLKHGVALRVWLGHLAEPGRLRAIVEAHRDDAARLLAEARRAEEGATRDPAWAYPAVVIRWGERYYQAQRRLAEHMLADLDRLAATRARRRTRARKGTRNG